MRCGIVLRALQNDFFYYFFWFEYNTRNSSNDNQIFLLLWMLFIFSSSSRRLMKKRDFSALLRLCVFTISEIKIFRSTFFSLSSVKRKKIENYYQSTSWMNMHSIRNTSISRIRDLISCRTFNFFLRNIFLSTFVLFSNQHIHFCNLISFLLLFYYFSFIH